MQVTRFIRKLLAGVVVTALLCSISPLEPVFATPLVLPAQTTAPASFLDKVRSSSDAEAFRIVLDLTAIPAYTIGVEDSPLQVVLELPQTANRSGAGQLSFNDPFVEKLRFTDLGGGRLTATIALKIPVLPKVSILSNPPRLVIDLLKTYESKTGNTIAPGLVYKEIIRGRSEGPIHAHIVEVDLKAGYTLKPVLSNDTVAGIETLSEMADRAQGLAMINGPYFMRSGEIIGLMKLNQTIVSTPDLPRTSFGVMPDGKLIFDAPAFVGDVELPDGTKIPIDGINRARGDSELILYNSYYAYWTLTHAGGMEFTLKGDKIVGVQESNSVIPDGAVVLSAKGRPAWLLSGLKEGERLKIVQTLGATWDKVVHAVGAGPNLVKNGEIYVTTLGEEFGSDVAGGRAPRTAIGLTREGKALLVVVDGRRRTSVGLSLLELAQFMQEQGAVEAMNLDGGGSSEMIVGDRIVNKPSDGRERRMGAGIAVVKTKIVK